MFVFFWRKKWFILCIAAVLVVCVYAAASSAEQVFSRRKPIYQGNPEKKQVAITVNVDWGEEHIPQMLDLFQKNRVKATFFISGRWASEHQQLVRKIAESGHEIGNHGFSHPHVNDLSVEENMKEIQETSKVIEQAAQRKTRYFAPPYGEYNDSVLEAAAKTKHQIILWTVDTVDWQKPPADEINSRVLSRVHNGAIILMHPTEPTLEALPEMLTGLPQQGYQIVPLEKLIAE
ncbi:MAG: polysaccharide deacetylase family protein [Thermacetogeniaceae bacterium]